MHFIDVHHRHFKDCVLKLFATDIKAPNSNQCLPVYVCVVSQYALDEFEALQEDLKLERDLRSEAEKFAHEVKAQFDLISKLIY